MSGPQLNSLRNIDSVWMALSVDDDGTEGVCAVSVGGMMMPLLAADEARLPFIIREAEKIAAAQQRLVRIVKMTAREEMQTIDRRL